MHFNCCLLIEFVIPNLSRIYFCILVFEYKITFSIRPLVLWIDKGYYVVKNLVWNVRIKDFWYTKVNLNETCLPWWIITIRNKRNLISPFPPLTSLLMFIIFFFFFFNAAGSKYFKQTTSINWILWYLTWI